MRLKSVRVQNYKSIIDSGIVEIEHDITALVGMTSSGKTSFLQMLAGLNPSEVFPETELPNGSETKIKFYNGELPPSKILQLTVIFSVEVADQSLLPDQFKDVEEIQIYRFFDGHFEIVTTKGTVIQGSIDLSANTNTIKNILENMKTHFTNAQPRIGNLPQFHDSFFKSIDNFLQETNFGNLKELDLSMQTLTNAVNVIPKDGPFQNELNQRMAELQAERGKIAKTLEEDPVKKLIDIIPKPLYKSDVVPLEDKIAIDEFINNPSKNKTFRNLAIISGLKPSGVQKVRNVTAAEQKSFFDDISKNLSEQLNSFWRQEKYDFTIGITANQLTFTVADRTTGKSTSVSEGSDGFKWWTSFFLEMSADLSERPGLGIVLLDNPATSLHDEGKADVLRFVTKMVETGKLQIVYTTHERALIDPWRIDRIRITEKRAEGTKIEKVKSDSRADLLERIRRNIGSPARYSLFGAPRTVAFEGESDMNIFSAFNEYLEQKGTDHLNKDTYSINSFNGITNAPDFCKLYKNLKLDFILLVDSGTATIEMKKRLDEGDYEKYFVEIKEIINRDGDTEDLCNPKLYHKAFELAYKGIIPNLPTFEEIEEIGENKKLVNRYNEWFKSNTELPKPKSKESIKPPELNKTIVAQQMFNILMQEEIKKTIEPELIENSTKNFIKLNGLIQERASKL